MPEKIQKKEVCNMKRKKRKFQATPGENRNYLHQIVVSQNRSVKGFLELAKDQYSVLKVVGYNRSFTAERDSWIAILPVVVKNNVSRRKSDEISFDIS